MAQEAEYLSLAELDLLEQQELEGFRPEMDANASRPPLVAGNYQAKITFANDTAPDQIWIKKQQDASKGGKVFYMAELLIETAGNGEDNDGRQMRFYASTLVMKGTGTTSIQQVLQPLGFGEALMTRTKTARTQIELLNEALEGGQALIGVKVDWEAQVYDKEADKTTFGPVRGMKRFPLDANGQHSPVIFKDLKGNEAPDAAGVNARNFIRGFLSLDALAGAGHVVVESDPVEEAVEEQGGDGEVEETPVPVAAKPAVRSTVPAVAPRSDVVQPVAQAAPQAQGGVAPRPAPRPTAAGRPSPVRRG